MVSAYAGFPGEEAVRQMSVYACQHSRTLQSICLSVVTVSETDTET